MIHLRSPNTQWENHLIGANYLSPAHSVLCFESEYRNDRRKQTTENGHLRPMQIQNIYSGRPCPVRHDAVQQV